jgi:hypothetical protein
MAVFSGFCESRAMRAVYYRCTAMAIKMVSKVDTFASSFCLLLLWLPPEAILASSGFRLALDMLHWVKPNVSLQRLTWPSKWPATEGHLYAAAAYIAWHNCS